MQFEASCLDYCEDQTIAPPAISTISLKEPPYNRMTRIRTTLVVKIKGGHKHKARMCLRGDQEPLPKSAFSSSPTVAKEFVRLDLSTFVNNPLFKCCSVDISQAFIQPDELPASAQIIAMPPDCVYLDSREWSGSVFFSKTRQIENN